MEQNKISVIHNMGKKSFEAKVKAHTAELNYHLSDGLIIFTHTGVPPALEGQGIGSLLVKTGLDFARQQNLKVRAVCWFVAGYIQRHAEYQDLLA